MFASSHHLSGPAARGRAGPYSTKSLFHGLSIPAPQGGFVCDPQDRLAALTDRWWDHLTNRLMVCISSLTFAAPSRLRIAWLTHVLMCPLMTLRETWSSALRTAVSC